MKYKVVSPPANLGVITADLHSALVGGEGKYVYVSTTHPTISRLAIKICLFSWDLTVL